MRLFFLKLRRTRVFRNRPWASYLTGLFWLWFDADENIQLLHQHRDALRIHLNVLLNVKHQHQRQAALQERNKQHLSMTVSVFAVSLIVSSSSRWCQSSFFPFLDLHDSPTIKFEIHCWIPPTQHLGISAKCDVFCMITTTITTDIYILVWALDSAAIVSGCN